MNDFIIQGTEPVIKIDSLGIGIKSYSNVDTLNLNDDEYLVVGDSQGNLNGIGYSSNEQMFTKHNLYVDHQGVAINTSRDDMFKIRDANTSLYVSRNIHCDGVINATGGIQFSNITLAGEVNSNFLIDMINKINDNTLSQPFKPGMTTKFNNVNDIGYPVKNVYTPNYITLGGHVDTHNNQHPLFINSTPNNDFNNIQFAIRNNASSDTRNTNLSKLSIGIIGRSYTSPAVISTTTGMPLEFHISKDASIINEAYNRKSIPTYLNSAQYPAMAINSDGTVCIGKDPYDKDMTLQEPLKLDVNGTSKFKDILMRNSSTGFYQHLDDIYVRASGISTIYPIQIKGGTFIDDNYTFNNISITNTLTTKNINNSLDLFTSNIETSSITINKDAIFKGNAKFINPDGISFDRLNISTDFYINNKRITPIDISDGTNGYSSITSQDGSNFIFQYINSNLVTLDFNKNLSFPNRLSVGNPNTAFTGILNVIKDNKASNVFDVILNTDGVTAQIGRVSYTGITDKSLVVSTNKIENINNNIYFYPSYNIENLQTDPSQEPMLSITEKGVGINNKLPRGDYHLDIKGKIAATDYYVSNDTITTKMSGFIKNNTKDYFNIFNENIYKYCINYDSISSKSSQMRGLNVMQGINSDAYYQNNIPIETLKSTTNLDGFYTNSKIAIGWNNTDHTLKVPLQICNTSKEDYNYSIIRIYKGIDGGNRSNDAGFSGIDICENKRYLGADRNLERWFIYKNHRYNGDDTRQNINRVGPLQFGYTDKTIDPTTFGLSMYYNETNSKYHVDFNNPDVIKVETDIPKSAVSIYGDLDVYGNINIIDNNSNNFSFRIKKLEGLSEYVNLKYNDVNSNIYSSNIIYKRSIIDHEDIEYTGKNIILTPTESIIVDPLNTLSSGNTKIPFIVKQNNKNSSVAKFITYSSNIDASSAIELCIHKNNLYTTNDIDPVNIKNKVKFEVSNDRIDNTILKFNYYKTDGEIYKPFVEFNNVDNSKTYMHLGQGAFKNDFGCNISLHIDDNNKCGIQITNTDEPIRINMVSREGIRNKYTILSSENSINNYKFNIGIANTASVNIDDVVRKDLQNVFTISPYENNNNLRKGAKFGFNEPFNNQSMDPPQTVVINSELDNGPTLITGRYTKDYIYTNVQIDTNKLGLSAYPTRTSNLYMTNILDKNYSSTASNILLNNILYRDIANVDIYGVPVTVTAKNFIYKTLNTSKKISYESIHSNIELQFSCLDNTRTKIIKQNDYNTIPYIDENKLTVSIESALFKIEHPTLTDTLNSENNYIENKTESENITIIVADKNKNIFTRYLPEPNTNTGIEFDLNFSNIYNVPRYLKNTINTSNISSNLSEFYKLTNNGITSNIITYNNIIDTYFNNERYDIEERNLINSLKNKLIECVVNSREIATISNTKIFLETKTSNIFYYNPLQLYTGNFNIRRKNNLNIYSSNIIPNTRSNSNYEIEYSSNTVLFYDKIANISSNEINIITSNVFIDTKYKTEIVPYDTIELIDNFRIQIDDQVPVYLFNTIKMKEYYKKYKNNEIIDIQLTEYNSNNFNPQIILSNKVDNDIIRTRDSKIHKIYSYDGNFKIGYEKNQEGEAFLFHIKSDGTINIKGNIFKNGEDYLKNINGNIIEIESKIISKINNEIYDTSNFILTTSNILIPHIVSEITSASNIISQRITNLTTDEIIEKSGARNRFLIDTIFNDNMTVNGNLIVNSNLIVHGLKTELNTITYTTENLSVINMDRNYVALNVQQYNDGVEDIFTASNIDTKVFNITNKGDVNIFGNYKKNNRDVLEDTSNYVTSTSNILITQINFNDSNTSNYIADTSNILNQYINSKSPWRVINNSKISYHSNIVVDGIIWCKQVRLLPANSIITDNAEISRDAIGDTSNYIESTSNILTQYINSKSPWTIIDNNNISYNSNVKIGTDLRVNGDVYCREVNIISEISDDRLKDYTSNIRNPIDLINKLNGFHYVPNNLAQQYGFKKIDEVGLSAQEVQIILPEIVKLAPFDMMRDDYNNLVSKSGENYLTISYERMAPLFVESIKALKKEINELRLEIAELRNVNK